MQAQQGVAPFKAIQQPSTRKVVVRDAHTKTTNNTGKERTVTKFMPREVTITEDRYIVVSAMGHITAMNKTDAQRVGVLENPGKIDPVTGEDMEFSRELDVLVPLDGGNPAVQFMSVTQPGVVVPLEQTASKKGGGE